MDIVIIPFHDYKKWINEGFRTRDSHLAMHFYKDKRVDKILIINRPTSLAETIIKMKKWRTSQNSDNIEIISNNNTFELCKINEKLYCLDIFVPEFFNVIVKRKLWWSYVFKNKKVLNIIHKSIDFLEMKDVTLLIQNPMAIGAIESYNYKIFAFDAIDNWLHHPQMKSVYKVVEKNYKIIEEKANIIFTVSKSLKELFENNTNVYWIGNGVDIKYFSKALSQLNNKTIGYIGKIQERVDFDLVEKCLKLYRDRNFIFIGPVFSQKRKIKYLKKKYNNIKFTGDIHYIELPNILKSIDIGIIPHTIDSFTDSMNPLKLYEYLAAGKPVISTDIAGVKGVSDYVYIGNSDKFVSLIEKISKYIESGKINSTDIVDSIPQQYTWEYISDEIISKLEML